jgi:hypothetical protein
MSEILVFEFTRVITREWLNDFLRNFGRFNISSGFVIPKKMGIVSKKMIEFDTTLHSFVYVRDAYSRSSVFHWIQEVRRGNEELWNEGRPGRPSRYEIDASIRLILEDNPNASLHTIAGALQTSPETVRNQMSRIGYGLKSLHWIPHPLTSEWKQVRKT